MTRVHLTGADVTESANVGRLSRVIDEDLDALAGSDEALRRRIIDSARRPPGPRSSQPPEEVRTAMTTTSITTTVPGREAVRDRPRGETARIRLEETPERREIRWGLMAGAAG